METIKHRKTCVLCGLAVEIDGFSITTQEGLQNFCCAGCLSIYQLLNDNDIIHDDTIESPLTTQP
jgi:hypothetical protein